MGPYVTVTLPFNFPGCTAVSQSRCLRLSLQHEGTLGAKLISLLLDPCSSLFLLIFFALKEGIPLFFTTDSQVLITGQMVLPLRGPVWKMAGRRFLPLSSVRACREMHCPGQHVHAVVPNRRSSWSLPSLHLPLQGPPEGSPFLLARCLLLRVMLWPLHLFETLQDPAASPELPRVFLDVSAPVLLL